MSNGTERFLQVYLTGHIISGVLIMMINIISMPTDEGDMSLIGYCVHMIYIDTIIICFYKYDL